MINDFERQNYFILKGYKILRYAGRTINENPELIIRNIKKIL